MKIYTKSGDAGFTSIQNNVRILKSNIRIKAYGTIDEVNSSLGIILSYDLDNDIRELLIKIQNLLFIVGADLSNRNTKNTNTVTPDMVDYLENNIDLFENELPTLQNFIIPGGNVISSHIHLSRSIIRRSETYVVELAQMEYVNKFVVKFLNRLSDLFFVIARLINKRHNIPDIIWSPT
ncbi:MAG: cob(I)yrinic acid a,c-diamide adenosyltransferase [Thaumarchaeota archaeon]|nr:cob(I)yrinic acid a,c-diamide adenosyltransferase [Nitrososphaerota archaeon]MCY3975608.1 cob(I)yrinic acid a,c-diamide adenosyltransferase [Nitrososphaerota archaeon]